MGLKCKVSRQKGGRVVVTNEDGTPSQLFQDALAYTNDQEQALNLWATASTPEFKEFVGKEGTTGDVSLGEVVRFYNSMKKLDGKLTPAEKYEIKNFMQSSGISTLSELTSKLKSIFQKDGTPEYSPTEAVQSGLFLPEDLASINLEKINDLINRMEGESLRDDFSVQAEKNTEVNYRNPDYKNILGASEFVSKEQVEQDVIALINDFNSPEEFDLKMQELGYPELVEKYFNDEAFAEEFRGRFKNLKKIQVVEEVNGELVAGTTATASIIRNTMLDNINTISLEADIDYISNIPDSIWKDSMPEVRTIIAEVEKELAEKNIDIIGLHKLTRSRAVIIDILEAAHQMMSTPSEENIQNFSTKYDVLFKTPQNTEVQRLENWQTPLTIIKLYTNKLPKELFEQHGLIKVGENLYHKVSTVDDLSSLYEYVFQEIKDGKFKLPSHLAISDITNKKGVLNDIANFINSRDTGFDFQNEKLSLYQVIFNHPKMDTDNVLRSMTGLSTVKTDENYLKTEFISDFYNYMLREKIANSAVYRETLSKFKITASDIQIVGTPANIMDLEIGQELVDYLKLKKDSEAKKFIPADQHGEMTEKLFYENNQEMLPQYEGPKVVNGALVSVPATAQNYIRIGNIAYRKVVATPTTDVFAMLQKPKDSSYFTKGVSTIGFDQRVADKMSEQDVSTNRELSSKDISTRLQKAGVLSTFVQKIVGKSTAELNKTAEQDQNTFENNLVSFIKQKGVTIVTDPIEVSKALESLGINSINQMFDFESMNINQTLTVNIVDGNKLRVVPSTFSKRVRTPEAAFVIANQILQKIKKYQKATAGSLFNENMATINGTTITLNIPAGLEDRVVAMQQLEDEMRRIIKEDKEFSVTDGGVNEELERGVDIDTLTDLGYNMLQTPLGEILGFEHKGIIYLDSARLNNNTTLHELIHVYQSMLSIKAKQGDTTAESIIQKRSELFQDLVNEWKEFHKSNTGVGGVNPMISSTDYLSVVNGFYSPLEKIIGEAKQDKMPAKQWAEKFARGEEAKWTGLSDWLNQQQGSVSKTEIQEFLKENRIEIVEVVKGGEQGALLQREFAKKRMIEMGYEPSYITEQDIDSFLDGRKEIDNTKFSQYQLEGEKENYKEVLITLPSKEGKNPLHARRDGLSKKKREAFNSGNYELANEIDNEISKITKQLIEEKSINTTGEKANFQSSHFDEANILLHLRMNTRTDAQGNKVLFLEEIQSDWGQKGKKEGFKLTEKEAGKAWEEADKKYADFMNRMENKYGSEWDSEMEKSEVDEETKLLDARENTKGGTIPQAPFVTDTNAWVKLGLKVALKEAIAQGADKIAWTTGEQQNDRYDLSKQVDKIDVEAVGDVDGLFFVDIELSNNTTENLEVENGIIREGNYKGQRLDNVIGKDYTDKILSTPKGERKTLQGADLKIGGKGMKGFYGNPADGSIGIVGGVAEKLFGQKVGTVDLSSNRSGFRMWNNKTNEFLGSFDGEFTLINRDGSQSKQMPENYETPSQVANRLGYDLNDVQVVYTNETKDNIGGRIQHSVDVTPEVKAQVAAGLPMFQTLQKEIGIDLSSPAYAQRPNESNLDYNERLLQEVEAYIVAPEAAAKLEVLKNTNKDLWQKVTDFIENLTKWLKGQIGLEEYQGDIMGMTMAEYVDALGVSVLKTDYSVPRMRNTNVVLNEIVHNAMILDSQLEDLSLHTETEEQELFDKMDNCGV